MNKWRLVLLLLLLSILTGCATFRPEPPLPFPTPPSVTFWMHTPSGAVCLNPDDAQALLKWFDQLAAFEAARQRVLTPSEE